MYLASIIYGHIIISRYTNISLFFLCQKQYKLNFLKIFLLPLQLLEFLTTPLPTHHNYYWHLYKINRKNKK